jgi:hypothetical protein
VIAVVILIVELLEGDGLPGWVAVLTLCVAAGGTWAWYFAGIGTKKISGRGRR